MTSLFCCTNCRDIPGPQCASQCALSCDLSFLLWNHIWHKRSCHHCVFQSLIQFLPLYEARSLVFVLALIVLSASLHSYHWTQTWNWLFRLFVYWGKSDKLYSCFKSEKIKWICLPLLKVLQVVMNSYKFCVDVYNKNCNNLKHPFWNPFQ